MKRNHSKNKSYFSRIKNLFFISFFPIITFIHMATYAENDLKQTTPVDNLSANSPQRKSWVWVGASLLLPTSSLKNHYLSGAQYGMATSFNKDDNNGLFYGASIVDLANDQEYDYEKGHLEIDLINASFVFGYEYPFAKNYLSFLFETGPSIGYRILSSDRYSQLLDTGKAFVFNGMSNMGFNVNFNPEDKVNVSLRVVGQVVYGAKTTIPKKYAFSEPNVNANAPIFYLPTVALAVRW